MARSIAFHCVGAFLILLCGIASAADCSSPLVRRAIETQGGRIAVAGVSVLRWQGTARIHATLTVDEEARSITVSHPDAPRTTLFFDEKARLVGARNVVPAPDQSQARIEQQFSFSAESMPGAVRWPRALTIRQNGKPYFDRNSPASRPRTETFVG